MAKPFHEWTDAEIESTRQTAIQAARVERVLDEAARASRALDALFASDEPAPSRAELAPPTAAPAPAAAVNTTTDKRTHAVADDEWKEQAREMARAIVKRETARSLYPPQRAIADEVAADLRKRGIFGTDGKPLTGATIKRHALRGISSAVKKAQSTILKRGK